MKFKGDIIITDPCYIMKEQNPDDWDYCEYGQNMQALGINHYLCRDTMHGDWSCTTYNSDTNEIIGQFCADAGLVAVFLLEDILKYNPDYNQHITSSYAATWIKDFYGEVKFFINKEKGTVRVRGFGNINFYTKQTGY